jgi:hypothetical protein
MKVIVLRGITGAALLALSAVAAQPETERTSSGMPKLPYLPPKEKSWQKQSKQDHRNEDQ